MWTGKNYQHQLEYEMSTKGKRPTMAVLVSNYAFISTLKHHSTINAITLVTVILVT